MTVYTVVLGNLYDNGGYQIQSVTTNRVEAIELCTNLVPNGMPITSSLGFSKKFVHACKNSESGMYSRVEAWEV